ncbi:MAG: adenosylhomocysteinase [Clostridia bacterium]|nr:adenosylhomocysteinase [Clostridia bacterium]MBQ9323830.1 adenosylhomocysteinase [Clostridia bacterium]MBQ9923471.1 adenosylhomocysteinase [Clostridia bacterium]MBR0422723.1 adenosylhomocysteinase [Clostridia bacterium]
MDSVVRDITLCPSGEKKIEWVRRNMPLLNAIRADFEREKPFLGLTVGLSVHLEAKTAYLCWVLQAGGANMIVTGSNPLSTQDDVAAALAKGNGESAPMHVYALHGCTAEEYERNIDRVLAHRPDILIDDGGDLVSGVMDRHPKLKDTILGGCEETTTGVIRLKAMERAGVLPFPMMDVNDADCKHLFDNRYGTGQSVFDGIDRTTNLIVAGKTCVVAGYGWCGKGVAMRAKGLGAHVVVTEVDSVKAIEAIMDGFAVLPMVEAAKGGDLFVTVTGDRDVITAEHFACMKNGAILCNAGHFDVEVDVKWLREHALERRDMKPNIEGFRLDEDRWVYVLAEGRLVNLASGDGHPAEIMDMSFAIQALSARYIAQEHERLEKKLYAVPKEIDERVARQKLASMGVRIDELTSIQAEYLQSWRV